MEAAHPEPAMTDRPEPPTTTAETGVAELKRELAAERRKCRALEALRDALDGAQCAALLVADGDGYVTFANAKAAELLGREPALLDGTILSELIEGGFAPLQAAARDGAGLFDGEPRAFVRPDGARVAVHCALTVLAQQAGEPSGYLLAAVELDLRREVVEARAQQQRSAALGRLADGIAHEINTPLQFVGDTLRFLRDSYLELAPLHATLPRLIAAANRDPEAADSARFAAKALADVDLPFAQREVPAAAERALEGLRRIATVVDSTRAVADGGEREAAPIDLNALVRHCVSLTRLRWEPHAAVEQQLAAGLPKVRCRIGEWCEVVIALLECASAAIAALPGDGARGRITLGTSRRGSHVELSLACSVSATPALEPIERIVVRRHGGQIEQLSPPNGGSTLVLRLPLATESK